MKSRPALSGIFLLQLFFQLCIAQENDVLFTKIVGNNGETLFKASATANGQYEPKVSVSTKKSAGVVLISIADNGNGIPQELVGKIFQPFFTTKPTGQGTELGLSLSYYIVLAHGGELKVDTQEGNGAEFIIQVPV